MPRYLFNFIGPDAKTFSDGVEMHEYGEPELIQRLKPVPAPFRDDWKFSHEEMVSMIAGEIENYRKRRYRGPSHQSWDRDRVWYVHPSITDDQADKIIMVVMLSRRSSDL
jgi:hypothetical protein